MKVNNKPNFFKRLLNDKTKMSFIIMALTMFITTTILVGFVYSKIGEKELTWLRDNHIAAIGGYVLTFLTTLFGLLRNGTKTREQKTLETLKAIETLHTKLTIINKQVKKLKKGKDNG